MKPLRIVIAPNSFKGTLTATEAARCIMRGLGRALPGAEFILAPIADGGDGTAEAIVTATGGRWIRRVVADPLGRRIQARFGLAGDGRTAIVEMANASGLVLVAPKERKPLAATTRGTGELIRAALDCGISRLVVGIGGSATTDGGAGMARALGVRFLDADGAELPEGGGSLLSLAKIDVRALDPRLRGVKIEVACDVTNPLFGPRGAACVYGPQKGATPDMVRRLDAGLRRLAQVVHRDLGVEIARVPGTGAAGGMGAGLLAFLKGEIRSGVNLVMEVVDLPAKLRGASFVITGEGRMDGQTAFGKAPVGVARAAKQFGLPVIALCGCLGPGFEKTQAAGIDACFSALAEPMDEAELRQRAPRLLESCAEQVGRLIALAGKVYPSPAGFPACQSPGSA